LGSIYSGFVKGQANLTIAVKPSFSHLNSTYTALLSQPYLYVKGADAFNETEGAMMQTAVLQVHIAQGYQQPCPIGFYLELSESRIPSLKLLSTPGACIKCEPNEYSLSPLAGPNRTDRKCVCPLPSDPNCTECPSCFDCPVWLVCKGGANVSAKEKFWMVEENVLEVQDNRRSRRQEAVPGAVLHKIFQPYRCPNPKFCANNNTCDKNSTGEACGKCNFNHVMQVGVV